MHSLTDLPRPVPPLPLERRRWLQTAAALALWGLQGRVFALTLADLSNQEATRGLQAALEQGAQAAVQRLGRPGGFLDQPSLRIPLPDFLAESEGTLRMLGQGAQVDALVEGMNRAAEAAIPLGRDVLLRTVRSLTLRDAKALLDGGDNAVTQFFAERTRAPLSEAFLPVVTKAVGQVGLAQTYNRVAEPAAKLNLLPPERASMEQYVTGKTLDGLYAVLGEEERKLRQNPAAAGSALLQKVFGAVQR